MKTIFNRITNSPFRGLGGFILLFLSLSLSAQNSDKISRVLEYRPAPGQHINRLFPTAAMSNSYEDALQWANNTLIDNKGMLGLGAFGGYVVVGFDHSIVNVAGEYDFKVLGNAFAGSSEPGVVMVCQDLNKNGIPDEDEPWYELAGSEYDNPETIKGYEITYYRPEGTKQNVAWTDNQGNSGEVTHISFATQNYMYPLWIEEDSYTLKGTKLMDNRVDTNGQGTNWQLKSFDWGYADNHPNNSTIDKIGFNIEWAVDENGESVHLDYIDFIKIHTAQVQEAGWLGETSTEISGIVDLHPDAVYSGINNTSINKFRINQVGDIIQVSGDIDVEKIEIISLQGKIVAVSLGENTLNATNIHSGVYLIRITDNHRIETQKIVIQ